LHLLQVLLWAGFYRWKCFPSWESAFYFSAASYSTVGYGDLVLPQMWRTLGPVESVTGVLMCGLSASFLFAIVTRLVQHEERFQSDVRPTP
jgi:voltage-gated potassium channel